MRYQIRGEQIFLKETPENNTNLEFKISLLEGASAKVPPDTTFG